MGDVFLLIVLISSILQLVVATLASTIAYRAMFCRWAWMVISAALWLMCFRRLVIANEIITGASASSAYWPEAIGLVLSGMMFWGFYSLNKCFQEELNHLTSLAEEMPAMVGIMTSAGYATHLNKRWYEYTGATESESLGFGWHNFIHPEDLKQVWEYWQMCLANPCLYEVKVRVKNKNGGYRWHVSRAVPIKDEKGKVHTWFGFMVDVHNYVLDKETIYGRLRES